MRYLLRKLVRLGGPISAKILKFGYYLVDGFYSRTEYCRICGFPIRHDNKLSTPWAEAEILDLVRKPYYVYPICKHCREHETWDKIYKAYSECWTDLFRTTDKMGFCWQEIQEALELNKKKFGVPGNIKMWKEILKDSYKHAPEGNTEFCGFKKGEEIQELLSATQQLGKDNIVIVKTNNRTSIRFIKHGKRKREEEKQRVIILPPNDKG